MILNGKIKRRGPAYRCRALSENLVQITSTKGPFVKVKKGAYSKRVKLRRIKRSSSVWRIKRGKRKKGKKTARRTKPAETRLRP